MSPHARRYRIFFGISDTKIVRNINNCTDLGNCLDPVNTYTGYKDISVYRNSFDALSTTLYTYLVSTCLFDILSPTSGNTAAATGSVVPVTSIL